MLTLTGVSKKYQTGELWAVNDISFTVPDASLTALLGPNGAGKTTTMKMSAALLTPSAGKIEINGLDSVKNHKTYRQHVGIHLGGDYGFYTRATLLENLIFFGSLAGMARKNRRQTCLETLERVGLEAKINARVETLSHGMKQRLHLARAILTSPAVVLLDEPTSGLDPSQAARIRELIAILPTSGLSVLLSTHQMSEAHQLADTVNIIDHGRLLISASPDELLRLSGKDNLEEAYLWHIAQQPAGDKR